MEAYLAPAILVAIIGLIFQGVKAGIDLINDFIARKAISRQRNIALFVALMQLSDAIGSSPGEKLLIKEKLVTNLLSDTISEEILELFHLSK